MSGSTARSDLAGGGLSIGAPLAPPTPGFEGLLPVTFVVDGVAAAPRVLAHRWDPDFTETVYALSDALRVTERKGVRGDVLCADWRFEGAGRVEVHAPAARGRVAQTTRGVRCALGGGTPAGSLHERPFADWLARHAPRLECASPELAEVYAYRWFLVYRNLRDGVFVESTADGPTGRALGLQLREARWMRSPVGAQGSLDAWTAGGARAHACDPLTPAIEFGEHHRLDLWAARDAALDYVHGRGRSPRIAGGGFESFPVTVGSTVTGADGAPDFAGRDRLQRVDTDVWHWGMVKALGGPDLREPFAALHLHGGYFRSVGERPIREVLGWEAALPFLYADFGPRERTALARAIDAWTAPHGLYSTAPSCPGFATADAGGWSGPGRHAATSWVLHALGAVAARTRETPLVERFARAWNAWTASHRALGVALVSDGFDPLTGRPYQRVLADHFRSAWLDTFFRGVLIDGLVDVGPLRVEGVPWKEDEISVERDGPGGPVRVTGSRRSSPPR